MKIQEWSRLWLDRLIPLWEGGHLASRLDRLDGVGLHQTEERQQEGAGATKKSVR